MDALWCCYFVWCRVAQGDVVRPDATACAPGGVLLYAATRYSSEINYVQYMSVLKIVPRRPHKIELKLRADLTLLVDVKLPLARRLDFSDIDCLSQK